MKDIAEIAGLSRQAVSAVLNGKKNGSRVSDENRRKILKIAGELKYQPNISALNLRGKSTKSILIILHHYPSTVHGELFRTANRYLSDAGYRCYYALNNPDENIDLTIREFLGRGIDGILNLYTENRIDRTAYPVPIVSAGAMSQQFDVAIDIRKGACMAAEHLIWHGHERMAYIGTVVSANEYKFAGFRNSLRKAGLEFNSRWQINLLHNPDYASRILDVLKKDNVTGIVASNDYIAGKLMAFLKFHGLSAPEDYAVTGFDGFSFCEFTDPPLTTVVQPYTLLAEKAVKLLLRKIRGKGGKSNEAELIEPELHIASSCGCGRHNSRMIYWEGTLPTLETLYDYTRPLPEEMEKNYEKV